MYKIKYKSDGYVERYKARLVAKWYNQIEGLDYFDIFALVAKLSNFLVLLAIASSQSWFLHQSDVNNAFLHGDLDEDVHMEIPFGINSPSFNSVCKLHKSLDGLKHVRRQWFA